MQSSSAKHKSHVPLSERPKLYVVCAQRVAETGEPAPSVPLRRRYKLLSQLHSVASSDWGDGVLGAILLSAVIGAIGFISMALGSL